MIAFEVESAMRRLFVYLLVLMMSNLSAEEIPAGGGDAGAPSILVFGDSLSAAYGMPVEKGWVTLLQQRLASQGYPHRVVNASVSGETTRGGLDRLPDALARLRPSIVVVELGANDGLQGKPVDELRARLEELVTLVRRYGAQPLLVQMRLPPNYGPAYIEKFVDAYGQAARKMDVPLTGFMLAGVAGDPRFIQDDGLHPNAAGQPLILDNLWPSIEPLLKSTVASQQQASVPDGASSP